MFPELQSMEQAPSSVLLTGLDQGQERGPWSLLSLSPSAPRLPFCQFERGFYLLSPRVTASTGSHQDISSQFW